METKIRKDNKKALPKYLLILAASLILGGVAGYFAVGLADGGSTENFGSWLRQTLLPGLPYLLPVIILAVIGDYMIVMGKVRKVYAGWDGEDEEISDWLDSTVNDLISVLNCSMPLSFLSFAAVFCWVDPASPAYLINAGLLLIYLGIVSFLQMKVINFIRTVNPEKQGSVFDPKFAKKWKDSCDEAEKKQIGEACYTVFRVMNTAYSIGFLVLTFSHIIFSTGLLPIGVVMVLWLISMLTFSIKAHQLNAIHK